MELAKRASLHRLKRLELWISLWVTRVLCVLAPICAEQKDGVLRDWIDRSLTDCAKSLINIFIVHINQRLIRRIRPKKARSFRDPRRRNIIDKRALLGGDLRRAFKAKTLQGRLAKLCRALDRREFLIARMVRRLRRGMTRRCSEHSKVRFVLTFGAFMQAALAMPQLGMPAADTS
jgi:hypothetical protein